MRGAVRLQAGEATEGPVSIDAPDGPAPDAHPPALAAMLQAVGAALRGIPAASPVTIDAAAVSVASANRIALLMAQGLDRRTGELEPAAREELESFRQITIRLNTANLLTLRRVLPVLESTGLPMLVFKGPVSQQAAYKNYFVKPSSDVDILVLDRDFDRTRDLLSRGEHSLAQECDSLWWRLFLGEQHMMALSPLRATIDLHHRVQQPGSVGPLHPERLLAEREVVMVAGMAVPTLSAPHAILLSCMSLAKAMVHREACGGHVADIAARYHASDHAARHVLHEVAALQGLSGTLDLGLHAAHLLFGMGERLQAEAPIFAVSSQTLVRMMLTPDETDIVWPKRRLMLWELCDSKLRYGWEVAWAAAAGMARTIAAERPQPF